MNKGFNLLEVYRKCIFISTSTKIKRIIYIKIRVNLLDSWSKKTFLDS